MKTPDNLPKTGECYHSAARRLMDMALAGEGGWVLVHGRPTLQVAPFCEYGHAWLERGETVLDTESNREFPRFLYYAVGNIDFRSCLVYTAEDVRRNSLAFGHWGPWEGVDGEGPVDGTVQQVERHGEATNPFASLDDISGNFKK